MDFNIEQSILVIKKGVFKMEDNNYRHEEFDDCFLCKHPALRHVLTGLLVFLGAFLASYVISDWHFKKMYDPVYQMGRMDRAIMNRERNFDRMEMRSLKQQQKMEKRAFKHEQKLAKTTSQFVHVEKNADSYKIILDLRPFDNDEKNVEVRTQGNTLIINAAGERNLHNHEEVFKYSQAFAFPEHIDTDEITKVREGNNYIITIPFD